VQVQRMIWCFACVIVFLSVTRKDFRRLFADPDMMQQVMDTVGSVLYERLRKKFIFDPKSGVVEEATPETYVEDVYAKTGKTGK